MHYYYYNLSGVHLQSVSMSDAPKQETVSLSISREALALISEQLATAAATTSDRTSMATTRRTAPRANLKES